MMNELIRTSSRHRLRYNDIGDRLCRAVHHLAVCLARHFTVQPYMRDCFTVCVFWRRFVFIVDCETRTLNQEPNLYTLEIFFSLSAVALRHTSFTHLFH